MSVAKSDLLDGDIEIPGARPGRDRKDQGDGKEARAERSSNRRSESF
jgi:hypothetical protein